MKKTKGNLAKCESVQCLAFGKENVRRCRLERIEGEKTCAIHHNYYTNWFENHSPIYSMKDLTDRKRAEYKFQILGNHIQITYDYLQSIHPIYHDYYIFLIGLTNQSPSINPKVLTEYIENALSHTFVKASIIQDPSYRAFIHNSLSIVLKDHDSCYIVYNAILSFLFKFIVLTDVFGNTFEYLEQILETLLLENKEWRQLLYSLVPINLYLIRRESYLTHLESSDYKKQLITKTIDPIMMNVLTMMNVIHKTSIAESMRQHTLGIIEKVYHPSRLQKWFDMGYGFETIDMMCL
jgi:hypothetical protein